MKIKEIANFLQGNLIGDGEIEILSVASLDRATSHQIAFVEKLENLNNPEKIYASCILVPIDFDKNLPCQTIQVNNPKLAFAKISKTLHPAKNRKRHIHSSAAVSKDAKIGKDVFIGAFCSVGAGSEVGDGTELRDGAKIGDNVTLGKNSVLHPNVFVGDNCEVGNEVILHSGVVIGTDGFGFVKDFDENKHIKFPQIGKVIIEDEVEIGANSCIDRGALGETRIGKGSKLDNLVQVAHNVNIGKRVLIAAQTGISGSVTIEDDCIIAGQVGFADHTTLKKGAVIGAKSAVFPGKIVREGYWSGIPVMPMDEYKTLHAHIKSLPRLKEKIRTLQKLVAALEKK